MVVDVLCLLCVLCVVCMFGCDGAVYNQGYVIKRWLTRYLCLLLFVCGYLSIIYQLSICLFAVVDLGLVPRIWWFLSCCSIMWLS